MDRVAANPIRGDLDRGRLGRPRTAHLAVEYADCSISPRAPAADDMLMIEPPPRWRIGAIAAWIPRNTPITSTSKIWRKLSAVSSSILARRQIAALLRGCRAPRRRRRWHRSPRPDASSDTSWRTNVAASPRSAATASPSSARRSVITTFAPSRTNRRAIAWPMPRAPRSPAPSFLPVSSPPLPVGLAEPLPSDRGERPDPSRARSSEWAVVSHRG